MYKKMSPIVSLLILTTFTLTACAPTAANSQPTEPQTEPTEEQIIEGQTYFQQSCAACHGAEGKGISNLGKDLTTSSFVSGMTDEELVDFIKQGRAVGDPLNTTGIDMPAKGGNPTLNDEQIQLISVFIRTIQE